MRNRGVLKAFSVIAPIFTWIFSFLFPGRKASVLAAECRNKCRAMMLVNNLENYMDSEGKRTLQDIVEGCYREEKFALWAVEGAGKDLGEWHLARDPNPKGILTNAHLDPKWDGAWLMLHAGMGLGFSKWEIEHLKSQSDEDLRTAINRVVTLCRENSRPGYYGAAIESLGLVSRFIHNGAFCRRVHYILMRDAPDSAGYFWRGVGRCAYFHPINFMPGFLRPARCIGLCHKEAPNPEMREAMLSGSAWAMTIVNMPNPEVMEWILTNHDDYFSGSPGFFNGVVSSVVMRYDTTPGEPLIQSFMNHRPDPNNRTLSGLWNSKIKGSLETALKTVYPVLKKHQQLDQVFHYQSLPALAARLEARSTRTTLTS
jgi:hypothetical protein